MNKTVAGIRYLLALIGYYINLNSAYYTHENITTNPSLTLNKC